MNKTPYVNTPAKTQLYGVRAIDVAARFATDNPGFVEIHFPAWTRWVFVSASTSDQWWTPNPRSSFGATMPNQSTTLVGVFSAASTTKAFPTARYLIETKVITLLNYITSPTRFWVTAALSDIPADAFPAMDANKDQWATYNSNLNDPT